MCRILYFQDIKSNMKFTNENLKAILNQRGFRLTWNKLSPSEPSTFGRRHFYLILLSIGNSKIHFDKHTFHLKGAYVFFANSKVPYATEILSKNHKGYSCLFTDEFIQPIKRLESIHKSPLFNTNSKPAFKLDKFQQSNFSKIFDAMIARDATDYLYKDDLMRNYIQLIVHEALQMRPDEHFNQFNNAAIRITTKFNEILEDQFPIEDVNRPISLKTAQDFANKLSIHVNYLNRSVKEITGKSTTEVIANRIIAEAMDLLRHTTWSVAGIAYTLGFEYPNYFSNFFKKMTGNTPKHYRIK